MKPSAYNWPSISLSFPGSWLNILWISLFFSWCDMMKENGRGNHPEPLLLLGWPKNCWKKTNVSHYFTISMIHVHECDKMSTFHYSFEVTYPTWFALTILLFVHFFVRLTLTKESHIILLDIVCDCNNYYTILYHFHIIILPFFYGP